MLTARQLQPLWQALMSMLLNRGNVLYTAVTSGPYCPQNWAWVCSCRQHPWYNVPLSPLFRSAEAQIAKEQAVLDARNQDRRFSSVSAPGFLPSCACNRPQSHHILHSHFHSEEVCQ